MLLSKQDGFGDKSKERTMRKLLFLGVALGAMAISSNGFTSTVSRPSAPHISGGSVARPSMFYDGKCHTMNGLILHGKSGKQNFVMANL